MATSTDDKAKLARASLQFLEPPSGQAYPDRHTLDRYWTTAATHLWRLLHVGTPDFDSSTAEGSSRVNRVLLVIARIKWLKALAMALDSRASQAGGALTWPQIYKYLTLVYNTEMLGADYQPFDDFMTKLVARLLDQLMTGSELSMHDHLQDQLWHAARGRLNASYLSTVTDSASAPRGRNQGGDDPAVRKCYLCGATDHSAWKHPKDKPITIPCPDCKKLHAKTGPLATPCKP
jgi:hypothetical protein